MSVARVTTINLKTKESADELVQSYTANAPSEFPEAKQLLQIRVDDTTVMAISLYQFRPMVQYFPLFILTYW